MKMSAKWVAADERCESQSHLHSAGPAQLTLPFDLPAICSMLRTHCFPLYVALVGLLLFSGCRTYGGYDTKPKTYAALQKAVQSFETELTRSKTDLQKLTSAAEDADALRPLSEQFQDLLDEHESLLTKQNDRVERLSEDSSYRNLHAAYGATVTEQRLMKQKYQRVIRTVRTTVQGASAQTSRPKSDRQYTIRPIGFPEADDQKQLSMEQALRGL